MDDVHDIHGPRLVVETTEQGTKDLWWWLHQPWGLIWWAIGVPSRWRGGLPRVPDALVQQCRRQPRTPPQTSGWGGTAKRRATGRGQAGCVRGQGANHRVSDPGISPTIFLCFWFVVGRLCYWALREWERWWPKREPEQSAHVPMPDVGAVWFCFSLLSVDSKKTWRLLWVFDFYLSSLTVDCQLYEKQRNNLDI